MLGDRWSARAAAVGIAAAIAALVGAPVAIASSRGPGHQAPIVRPHFRFVADAISVWTGSRYALAAGAASPVEGHVTLIDDQTGQVKTISRAGCTVQPLSSLEPLDLPWIPFNCNPPAVSGIPGTGPAWELYSPAMGQWQPVSPSPAVTSLCSGPGCSYDLSAAGTHWLQFHEGGCSPDNYHVCYGRDLFQDIQTGEVRQDPSSATTTVDLDAPDLAQTLCLPLRVPTAWAPYATQPGLGSLVFYRSFALSIGTDFYLDDEIYLERCGTSLHRRVGAVTSYATGLTGANTHEVVWMAHPGPLLSALTLPRLQPFTIRLPEHLLGTSCSSPALVDDYRDCVGQLALTNHRLYLLSTSPSSPGQLWVAPNLLPPTRQDK